MLLNRLLTFLLCLSLFYLFIGCQRGGNAEKRILAKIGDETITVDEFNREFDRVRLEDMSFDIRDKLSLNKLKANFLNRLLERRILLAEAQRRGISISGDELNRKISLIKKDYPEKSFVETLISEYVRYEDWEERVRMKLLIEKLINIVIIANISIGDEEIEKYYQDHPQEFLIPEQVKARQILVGTEVDARDIVTKLRSGEDFTELAKDKSLSPDGKEGGDLGYFSHGHMPPEFDKVIFSLGTGRLSKIVKSPYGYHIFKLEERRKASKFSLYEVYEQIKEKLRQERAEQEYGKWLEKIKNTTKVEVNHQLLEEISE